MINDSMLFKEEEYADGLHSSEETKNHGKDELSQTLNHNSNHHNFTVAVRIKPKDHIEDNVKIIINKNCKEMSIETTKHSRNNYSGGKCKTFKMDAIFQQKATNQLIFGETVKERLSLLKKNQNVALMAYGATNSGKTYTILGSNRSIDSKNEGLVHLSYRYLMQEVFQGSFKFYFSYLEIYNENIQDLLCDQQKRHNLNVFEDHTGKINIPDLTRIEVSSYNQLHELIQIGSISRAQSSNNVNKLSSRSHAILQLEIFSVQDGENQVTQTPIDANFMIIDLAGSQKSTPYFQQCQQLTLKEGSNINRSLLSLGNCIKSLANGQPHIPYRNSKLTRLLKENLSGSCHNIMIACISHTAIQFEESISTLQYASKACRIESAQHMTRGRDRGKFVSIPCEHCKMSLDFGYLCKGFKQYAFDVVDLLTEPKRLLEKLNKTNHPSERTQVEKRQSEHDKLFENCLSKIKSICKNTEQLEYLNKFLQNIENSDPKIEIQIQETEDSQREISKLIDHNNNRKSKMRLKAKPTINAERESHKHINNNGLLNEDSQRPSKARSQRSIRLRLKQTDNREKKQNNEKQSNNTSYIRIQQQPKSLNISSINSRKQEMVNNHQDHYVPPFLPELSLDISQFFNPKDRNMNGRIEKDFDNIQFIKHKRNSQPRTRFYSKQNKQNSHNMTNTIQQTDHAAKTYRDRAQEQQNTIFFAQSKTLRRMKQDVIGNNAQKIQKYCMNKQQPIEMSDKELKSKIKLIARVR